MIAISIKDQQETIELDYQLLKAAALTVLEGEGVAAAKVTFAIMDNATIHVLNKRHLDHDEPTDVLTFPYSAPSAKKLEGDIAIGAEIAQAQANERGHPVLVELQYYMIHGCLHLCGYDDRTDDDRHAMRARERHYLKQLGLPDITGE
jgi:probable rRNA maturation factor